MKNINIPPLFIQLDELSSSIDDNNYECWREKARLGNLYNVFTNVFSKKFL